MRNLRLRSIALLSVVIVAASTVLTVVPAAAEPADPPGVDLEVYTATSTRPACGRCANWGWMRRMLPHPTPRPGPAARWRPC